MNDVAVKTRKTYSEAEVTRSLIEVAACAGNTHMAARNLAEDDTAPSPSQQNLWLWSRRDKVEQYERLRAEALPAITAEAAEAHMNLAQRQMEASEEAADLVKQRLTKMEDKDLVNAMGKFDIGSGIHTEKAQLLSGQPTQITQRDPTTILRLLKNRGYDLDLPAEEDSDTPIGSQGYIEQNASDSV